MNMIGFGPESIGMGGADLAVTETPSAMNINPAGIGRCLNRELDLGASLMRPSLSHSDRFGNDKEDVLDRYPMPFLAYVHPVRDFTYGVGLFVQGGLGAEYQGLSTPFSALAPQLPSVPETDATITRVIHAKITPTMAWRIRPKLTVGASLNVSYARAEMGLFPETSLMADRDQSGEAGDAPGEIFFGMKAEDVSAVGYGLRVGVQYQPGALAIGAAYSTETSLDFDGGTMSMNLAALGLGKVEYDCKMTDFAWPRQAGLGLAYRVKPSLLIAADVDWIDWSSAIKTLAIEVESPDVSGAPPSAEIPFLMNWDDQWVWALGMEHTPVRNWRVRLGYNHGNTPIPDSTLRPLFPAIGEDHITGGFGVTRGPWTFDLGLEYVLESRKTNNNRELTVNPFGPGSQETLSQVMGHFKVRLVFPG
jgi:long-chain fatty acid transport protein